ncbi:CinA family nicotinamide mononucleotide deamidase-related protein [Ferruginibacter albus]|uniref:CinA family nicotinamide mononucleotide deamidase-related protein n=1 Tax=Ferruginibacter albus TaxID=2875540 RepID=UPI001CC56B43|nr:CinA family nicotinamide mononucleotide deamidase-related protein [Ferruginibacter albus]UAY51018.1 CinA family nicotinamide mononucleotide deamidase-related protein [Ferruginibacter albus]
MIKASIITIGDELLIGQVVDTNSAWMAQELNKAGIPVLRRVSVGDDWNEIWRTLNEESKNAHIILITGGLGPTSDDITKQLLCTYFSGKMVVNEEALANIKYLFENVFKRPLIERNLKQAEVPDTCKVIINKRGTAPGMWFERPLSGSVIGEALQKESLNLTQVFVAMPGVPHEMKGIMQDDVIPLLKNTFSLAHIFHRTLLTAGVGESFLAEQLNDFEASLPSHIKLAYLPNYGMVRLRLSTQGFNESLIQNEIDLHFEALKILVKDHLVTTEDETMENVIANLLLSKNKIVATAESCTGGYIAHLLTSIPGSSKFYNGSVISYSNDVKEELLFVDEELIKVHGAVSEQVAVEMATGILNRIESDYAIAVSGIMGPDGGSAEKPVGTVWIAVGNKDKITTQLFHFRVDRLRNIQLTALNALNLLRKFILEE